MSRKEIKVNSPTPPTNQQPDMTHIYVLLLFTLLKLKWSFVIVVLEESLISDIWKSDLLSWAQSPIGASES